MAERRRDQRSLRRQAPSTRQGPSPGASPGRAATFPARFWLVSLALFALALAFRLIVQHQISTWPLFDQVEFIADSRYYDLMARRVAGGNLVLNHAYFLSPLYIYLLAAAYALFGTGPATAFTLQAVLSAASCVLAYWIGRRLFGEIAGLIAGLLLALYGFVIYQSMMLLPGTLVLFLNLLALWIIVGLGERLSPGRLLAGGLVIGLAAAAKANALLLVPAAGLVILLRREHTPLRRWQGVLLLATGSLLAVAPFTLHNYAASDRFVLLSTTGGRNLWKGNGPGATGTHAFMEKALTGMGLQPHMADEVDAQAAVADSRRLTEEALQYMATHPGRTAQLWLEKLGLFFHARELGIRDQYYFIRQYVPLLRLPLPAFAWVVPLGLVGLVTALRAGRGSLIAAFLAAQVLSFVLIFVLGRYRLVAVACLAILAGHQFVWWWQALRTRLWRPLAVTGVLLLIALLLVNRPLPAFPTDRGFGDQYLALGRYYMSQRDFPTAIETFSQALEARWVEQPYLASSQADARFRIGLCQFFLGRKVEARDTLAQLLDDLRRDPDGVEAAQIEEIRRALQQVEQSLAAPDSSRTSE
ncbi:MAG: glycosyltransferase family 39 protein [Candidatus Eisenbacteria sp.]|nr:glycosyltransferase family 39 protein [Candidatus Eisenbacteria bacterium]